MSLFNRIKTAAKADAHGVIDALEDRALMLRQCVRDAEAELQRKLRKREAVELELRSLQREEKSTVSELLRFEADADVALSASNDELSRYALKGVLMRRARQQRQLARREALETEGRELDRLLLDQTQRYEELKERVDAQLAATASGRGCELEPVIDQ